ncbi:MAG: nucleotidyltransferase family protein [Bacteroidales bacterium]|jgi:NDP-sugar pyrophosphorylase family protein|nr:nucleotidyltransferase family protein [Bacteroidales bacterium]
MKAMIMAAGKGTRLGKITDSVPKALVDINGKSILRIAVENCNCYGFDDVIINVHHFAEDVIREVQRLKMSGFRVSVSDESEELLETGGGLFKARHFFDEKPFLVYNCDIITDLNLSLLYEYHLQRKGIATVAVRNRRGNRFLLVDNRGLLCGWTNVSTGEEIIARRSEEIPSKIAFSGIHVIDPLIFRYMKEGKFSLTTLYLSLAADNKIYTFRHDDGYWFDIGTPENLEIVRKTILE